MVATICVCKEPPKDGKIELIDNEYCKECHIQCMQCDLIQEWLSPSCLFYECSQCDEHYCVDCIITKRNKEWWCDDCLLDELKDYGPYIGCINKK